MKKRLIVLIITPVLGAILGFLLAYTLNIGWFGSKWQKVENPPGNIRRLVAVSQGSLWVQSDSGTFYYNENPSSCKIDCWQEVSEIPTLPMVETDEASATSAACAPAPPLISVTARISECQIDYWMDRNVIFALRRDGSIYLWQVDLFKEWSLVLMALGVCFGAIGLFIPVSIVLLLTWLINRTKKKQREITSTTA